MLTCNGVVQCIADSWRKPAACWCVLGSMLLSFPIAQTTSPL
jgi:hypothetical protein